MDHKSEALYCQLGDCYWQSKVQFFWALHMESPKKKVIVGMIRSSFWQRKEKANTNLYVKCNAVFMIVYNIK